MPAVRPLSLDDVNVRWCSHVLRATVVLQCLGNARWFLQVRNTPLFGLFWSPPAAGGVGIPEQASLMLEMVIGWGLLVFGAWVLWRPQALPLLLLSVFQLLIAFAMSRIGIGFLPIVDGLPPQIASLFPLGSQLGRVAAPLALCLLTAGPVADTSPVRRMKSAEWIMRGALSATFVLHGLEAIQQFPKFIDLIVGSTGRLVAGGISESLARSMLTVIGWIDVTVGVLVLTRRWTLVALYMAVWGLLASCSRVVAEGPVMIHELLTRMPHAGVPLALALYWNGLREQRSA